MMEDMKQNGDQPTSQPAGGYGQKGGWKKWLLIYVVIAVIVYGLVYYFVLRNNGSYTPTINY